MTSLSPRPPAPHLNSLGFARPPAETRVVVAMSGGVDSSVAAVLIHEAIGDQLTCVFVDHGLLRQGEAEEVVAMFRDAYNIPLVHADESDLFLGALEGVSDPEVKRKTIGRLFIEVFEARAAEVGTTPVPVGAGAMAAILGLSADQVVAGCAQAQASFGAGSPEVAEAVNFNDPGQTVIAGTKAGVDKALLKEQWGGAVDTVGGDILFNVVKSLQRGASAACCGLTAGTHFQASVLPFILRGVNLLGVDSVEIPLVVKASMWDKLSLQWKLANLDELAHEIGLEQLPEAIERILAGGQVGRVLVRLD